MGKLARLRDLISKMVGDDLSSEDIARAVLLEMRDPSEEMISAGSDAETVDNYSIGFSAAEQCYQFMIDAASKEAK